MADRFPGGVISKTPPEVVAPVDGEGGSASGVWTLDEVLGYEKAGAWPKKVLPREMYLWGSNSFGRLGDDSTINKSSPVQVGTSISWSQVELFNHSLAVGADGTLWAWGPNSNGQLGDNTIVNRSSPVQIGALTNWSQVSAGYHTAAVKTDGTLWTWGYNGFGQLGDGTIDRRSSPVQIGALTNWAQVAAGSNHTAVIKTDGTMWTWGSNGSGRLGDGTVIDRSSPVQIGALTNWSQVSAGGDRTNAVKTDGTLWSWGDNNVGQLGLDNYVNYSSPVQVGALTNWSKVSASKLTESHALATKTDGTLWGWGRNNNYGQIGDGTQITKSSPVQIGALTNWSQAAAGGTGHSIALKTDGTMWAWGRNSNGQLGDDTTVTKSSPIQVGALTSWSQVAAGGSHTAALARG